MTITNLHRFCSEGYSAPSAEEIALIQEACLCVSETELAIPDTTEVEGSWD